MFRLPLLMRARCNAAIRCAVPLRTGCRGGIFSAYHGFNPIHARAHSDGQLADLRSHVSRLYEQGKYADAVVLAERYVSLDQRGEQGCELLRTKARCCIFLHNAKEVTVRIFQNDKINR
jgi:hypothetical protein